MDACMATRAQGDQNAGVVLARLAVMHVKGLPDLTACPTAATGAAVAREDPFPVAAKTPARVRGSACTRRALPCPGW